jgi:hypothetical protein
MPNALDVDVARDRPDPRRQLLDEGSDEARGDNGSRRRFEVKPTCPLAEIEEISIAPL